MNNFRIQWLAAALIILIQGQAHAQYLSGYGRELQGETLKYESHQPDATHSLLVRSEEERKYIEWETDTLPADWAKDRAEFILLAGIDVNAEDNHSFNMYINDELHFTFRNPLDTLRRTWDLEGGNGVALHFEGMMIDKYGDLFGYLFLSVPTEAYPPGVPLRIKVTGETAGSRSWFMVFKYSAVQQVKFIPEQALLKTSGKDMQLVRVDLLHFDRPAMASIRVGLTTETFPLSLGFNMIRVPIPNVNETTLVNTEVRINDREIYSGELQVSPVEQKTIYLMPHSHVDIGYTHVQEEVEAIQWQNIRDAVSYAQKTKDYPEGARFKWSAEVMWAVDSYLEQCSEEEKKELTEAVQNGSFELDGLYANILTGLCRPEELYRMLESAVEAADELGTELSSAMITDIPGYTWGIVPVLAQSGVDYFSIGTNTFHRIGDIIETWGDRPFYWASASGTEKVLCWVHGKGYSEFHTGLAYTRLRNKLKEQLIFDYINELVLSGYPYDIVTMRYNIGSDNGPPDPYLSDIVRSWNEKYTSPKLVISTVGEAFGLFEEKYGSSLPTYRGDLTGYWEDGAASSARETAMNRASAERLTQASALYSLLDPQGYPGKDFDLAWKNILLYSEHTWGSWNSISEPHSPFTLQQWETKKSFAEKADSLSRQLLSRAIPASAAETATMVDVYNTSSWSRTDKVCIPADVHTRGDLVKDTDGRVIPAQRLSTGELVFVAGPIPPYTSRRYFLEGKEEKRKRGDEAEDLFYLYNHVDLELDEADGSIKALSFRSHPQEFVQDSSPGLNAYRYVDGRRPENVRGTDDVRISMKEDGPVLRTIRIESAAPGCESLIREITLYKEFDRVDITNIVDKKEILDPEGVHFLFPFNVPDGVVRISNAWNHYTPEVEQMPGSNKNFLSVNRWADVSNDSCGMTFIPLDAPLVEIGGITCDPIEYGWIDTLEPSQTLVSYVMNNYWETNYKAGQSGEVPFRYVLIPHREFDPLQAEKWGIEQHQPLLPVVVDPLTARALPGPEPLETEELIIESLLPVQDGGMLLRVYNPGDHEVELLLHPEAGHRKAYLCDPFGRHEKILEGKRMVRPMEVLHLLLTDN